MSSLENSESGSELSSGSGPSSSVQRRASKKIKQMKVKGRGRGRGRGRKTTKMSEECVAKISQLTGELGLKTDAETIKWLVDHADDPINGKTGTETMPAVAAICPGEAHKITELPKEEKTEGASDDGVSKSSKELAPEGSNLLFSGRQFWMVDEKGEKKRLWPVPLELTLGLGMRIRQDAAKSSCMETKEDDEELVLARKKFTLPKGRD